MQDIKYLYTHVRTCVHVYVYLYSVCQHILKNYSILSVVITPHHQSFNIKTLVLDFS